MGRPAAKANKTKPACANQVRLFAGEAMGGFTVYRVGRAKPKRPGGKRPTKPRPRKWAHLAVFMDVSRRSYHVGWNGERFAHGEQLGRIERDVPAVIAELLGTLPRYSERLIASVAVRSRAV